MLNGTETAHFDEIFQKSVERFMMLNWKEDANVKHNDVQNVRWIQSDE